jgi:hypothetical protein
LDHEAAAVVRARRCLLIDGLDLWLQHAHDYRSPQGPNGLDLDPPLIPLRGSDPHVEPMRTFAASGTTLMLCRLVQVHDPAEGVRGSDDLSGTSGHRVTVRQSRRYSGPVLFDRAIPPATPQFAKQPGVRQCDKWCVFTSINPPTKAVNQCAAPGSGWCAVVVGDLKSPSRYNSTAVYLSPAAQERLPYRTLDILPWNHFGRYSAARLTIL